MQVDADGVGAENVYKAGEIYIPPGYYRVEEIAESTVTIRRLPAADDCLSFRFHQKAPEAWRVGFIVECRLNPRSPTGRTIKLREAWDEPDQESNK